MENKTEPVVEEEKKELTAEQIEDMKKQLRALNIQASGNQFHTATKSHGNKKRGVGITRKIKEQSKKNRKISANSRKKNRR